VSQKLRGYGEHSSLRQPGRQRIEPNWSHAAAFRFPPFALERTQMTFMHKLSSDWAMLKDAAWVLPALAVLSCQLPEPKYGPTTNSVDIARLRRFASARLVAR